MKTVTFITDDDLQKQFKIRCISSNIEMKVFLNSCLEKAVKDDDFFQSILDYLTTDNVKEK